MSPPQMDDEVIERNAFASLAVGSKTIVFWMRMMLWNVHLIR